MNIVDEKSQKSVAHAKGVAGEGKHLIVNCSKSTGSLHDNNSFT